jgi:hypothetical protein
MKNNIFKSLLLLSLSLILFKNLDLFKKSYFVLTKSYAQRINEAYKKDQFSGFCSKESHGYIFYIKEKYKITQSPLIINLEEKRRKIPYWIFYNLNEKTNDKELILLNYEKSKKNMIKNFTIIDNYDDKCLYLERKNGNT